MNNEGPNVLYVDDEDNSLISFKASFRRSFNIFTAKSGAEAVEVMEKNEIHILIADQKMPGMPGVELLHEAFKRDPKQVRILLTAFTDFQILSDAVNRGYIFRCIDKPWKDDELNRAITEAYEYYKKNQEGQDPNPELDEKKKKLENHVRQLEESIRMKKELIESLVGNS